MNGTIQINIKVIKSKIGGEIIAKSTYLNEGRKKNDKITLTEFPSYKALKENCYMGGYPTWTAYKGRTIEEVISYLNKINKSYNYVITNLKTSGKKRIAKVKIKRS